MSKVIPFFVLVSISTPCTAEEWVQIFKNSDGDIIYIDNQSIKQEGSKVKVMEYRVSSKPHQWPGSILLPQLKKTYYAATVYDAFNCSNGTWAALSMAAFSKPENGKLVGTDSWDDIERRYEKVSPGGHRWEILKYVCNSPKLDGTSLNDKEKAEYIKSYSDGCYKSAISSFNSSSNRTLRPSEREKINSDCVCAGRKITNKLTKEDLSRVAKTGLDKEYMKIVQQAQVDCYHGR
jgi:hypothetical protein